MPTPVLLGENKVVRNRFASGGGRSAPGSGEVDVDVDRWLAHVGREGREGMQAEDGLQAGLVHDRIA